MPDKPRKDKMNPNEIEIHHVWSRCVGRAYLIGKDPLTGIDYSYRREWIESLIEYLNSVFAAELGTYHLMSNHMHDVSRSRPDIAAEWSDEEVVWRWKRAWPRYENGEWIRIPTDEEIEAIFEEQRHDENRIPNIRRNLANISWYQARLKQSIARLANIESNKRGHHWEQRFGNRKLENEGEVLTGFLYNDLQQVRAGVVDTVEASDYSAIQRQIRSHARRAFADVHYREPREGHDDDAQEVEQFETLFADCFLAPIRSDGPLLTVPESTVPQSELVLPQGYLFEQQAESASVAGEAPSPSESGASEPVETDSRENSSGESESDAGTGGAALEEPIGESESDAGASGAALEEGSVGESESDAGASGAAFAEPIGESESVVIVNSPADNEGRDVSCQTNARRRGRPRRERRYTIHGRLLEQLRRRASRCSILGLDWNHYYDIVKELERQIVAAREQSPPVPTEPPGAVPDSCSPTNWWRSVRDFKAWLQRAATNLPEHLASYLLPRPRSDPPVAD